MLVIKSSRMLGKTLCKECSEAVVLVTLDEAVKISGLSSRAIYRLIEEGRVHFDETASVIGLMCRASLIKSSSFPDI